MKELARYLSIKNWSKFQPKLKNGKDCRDWIRVDTRLEDDPEFLKLSFFARAVLQGIWRMRGATGRNVPDDVQHIRRYLAMSPQECSCLRAALEVLKSYGWLVPCNQQTPDELAPPDQTGRDETSVVDVDRKTEIPLIPNIDDFREWMTDNCSSMDVRGQDRLIAECLKVKPTCTLKDIVRICTFKLATSKHARNPAGLLIAEVPKIIAGENGESRIVH